jgi:hypothetical protein
MEYGITVIYAGARRHTAENDRGLPLWQRTPNEFEVGRMDIMRRNGGRDAIDESSRHIQQMRHNRPTARQLSVSSQRIGYLQTVRARGSR